MYRLRTADVVAVALVAVAVFGGVLLWPQLPDQLAIHWNAAGVPDSFVGKPVAVLGIPLFAVGVVLFVRLAPDSLTSTPDGEDLSVLFLGGTFAYVQALVYAWNLGFRFDVALAVVPVLLLAAGLVALEFYGRPLLSR